jgi:hypothetical protein
MTSTAARETLVSRAAPVATGWPGRRAGDPLSGGIGRDRCDGGAGADRGGYES